MPAVFAIVFIFSSCNLIDRICRFFGSRTYVGDELTLKGTEERLCLFLDRFGKLKQDVALYMSFKKSQISHDEALLLPGMKEVDEETNQKAIVDSVNSELVKNI